MDESNIFEPLEDNELYKKLQEYLDYENEEGDNIWDYLAEPESILDWAPELRDLFRFYQEKWTTLERKEAFLKRITPPLHKKMTRYVYETAFGDLTKEGFDKSPVSFKEFLNMDYPAVRIQYTTSELDSRTPFISVTSAINGPETLFPQVEGLAQDLAEMNSLTDEDFYLQIGTFKPKDLIGATGEFELWIPPSSFKVTKILKNKYDPL